MINQFLTTIPNWVCYFFKNFQKNIKTAYNKFSGDFLSLYFFMNRLVVRIYYIF